MTEYMLTGLVTVVTLLGGTKLLFGKSIDRYIEMQRKEKEKGSSVATTTVTPTPQNITVDFPAEARKDIQKTNGTICFNITEPAWNGEELELVQNKETLAYFGGMQQLL